MTTDAEALVRRAYHFAQGDVLEIYVFIDLFAEDGVFNAGQERSDRGEHLGDVWMGKLVSRDSVYGYWYETIEPCRLRHRWSCVRVIVLGWRP